MSVKIERRDYELAWQAVLFTVSDHDDKFVCGVALDELCGNGTSNGDLGLKIFDERQDEILDAASDEINQARARGVRHKPGQRNQPLFIHLAK